MQMGLPGSLLQQTMQLLRRNASLAFLPADVDLQQDILHLACPGGDPLHLVCQMQGIHRLDHGDLRNQILDLVGLQLSDELNLCPGVILCLFGFIFLHPVFPQQTHAAFYCHVYQRRIHSLGHCHQLNLFLRLPVLCHRLTDPVRNAFVILPHLLCTTFHLRSLHSQ